jgi:uncharacterized membrane protein YczE
VTTRFIQLFLSCVVLGAGIALLLDARLGSDGFSTLVNGLRLWSDTPFWLMNLIVSALFVLVAMVRGLRPGIGTIIQIVVVGFSVSLLLPLTPGPSSYTGRALELGVALVLLGIGVAGYLASELGAGPAEAVAIAFDPPVAFRWTYSAIQISAAIVGWFFGADVGIATLIVVFFLGPLIDLMSRFVFRTDPSAQRRATPTAASANS